MKAGIVKSGSANIYYELSDNFKNKVLVLLHGNGQSIEKFRGLIKILENNYNVLAIDSRGHGKSEFGKAQLTLGTMAGDVESVLEELNIKKVNILGFGDGANIAMLFAIRCSDMVDKLIICGGNYNFSGYSILNRIMLMTGYLCSVVGVLFDSRNRINREYFALIVKEPHLKRTALRAIKAGTLVVSASGDMITLSHSRNIAKTIKNARLLNVNGGRFWLFENPNKACSIIIDFIEK